MVFSSLVFLFCFFPLVLLTYFVIGKFLLKKVKYKNLILCIFSIIFYAWGEPKYIFLMLFSIIINYFFALLIDKSKDHRKLLLASIIAINVGLLLYFKYTDFFLFNLNNIFGTDIPLLSIGLPIGISFYTFQILSYVIDVYRKKVKVQRNIIFLATYISLFPQLIAGPIVRYETIEKQLTERKETLDNFISGFTRFIMGLAKKVLIANNAALVADLIFSSNLESYGTPIIILGVISYTIQIYFDFSGYSDMAIGIGKIFGFKFLENFNYPYLAKSATDFWRRWHISLSTFFRDYVYIPLGGNKVSSIMWIRNMSIVWIITGFWHGASWNYVLWGVYYLIILILEKKLLLKFITKLPSFIQHIYGLFIICIGWTIFRLENTSDMLYALKTLFIYKPGNLIDFCTQNYNVLVAIPFLLLGIIFSMPVYKYFKKLLDKNIKTIIIYYSTLGILFLITVCFLISSTYNPFIYFRF